MMQAVLHITDGGCIFKISHCVAWMWMMIGMIDYFDTVQYLQVVYAIFYEVLVMVLPTSDHD
jgi:hypothetical protein